MDRRSFVQLSAAALIHGAAAGKVVGQTAAPIVSDENGVVAIKGEKFSWQYERESDAFRLIDRRGRGMVSGRMQPAVVVARAGKAEERFQARGKVEDVRVAGGKVAIRYAGVNGAARLEVTWRFDAYGVWLEPVVYEAAGDEDVVSLHYFVDGGELEAGLHATYLVTPGIVSGSTISPILRDTAHLDESIWLGRGSPVPGLMQQWGLPVHYFCGFSLEGDHAAKDVYTQRKSDAFTCGLADLPNGDLFLKLEGGKVSPWVSYRSDIWKHMRGPGKIKLGATWFWAAGADTYESIAAYYQGMLDAGVIPKKDNSEKKTANALTPQFCTWGSQVTEGRQGSGLDEAFLRELYGDLKKSGMKAGLFSIDDKWEGAYGNLEHSVERFPRFEEFLAELRRDGMKVGMWAAIMRCEKPEAMGLTVEHMLQTPEGKPFVVGAGSGSSYYILDFTQPEVAEALTKVVRAFVRRYKPDIFKFDFGYELPAVGDAAPRDKRWSGERMMWKGLDVVIKAMREENPDQVVMYYNLSPLFLEFFDLHSPDDLFLDTGDYEVEANRRFYFSSLMGRLGVPTYGSSGYDWASAPSIWFDSAAVGTVGFLGDFRGDEQSETATPWMTAKYNGVTQVLRRTAEFEVLPLGNVDIAPSLGAHAKSWARFERGELVLYARRPMRRGEDSELVTAAEEDARVAGVLRAEMPVIVAAKDARGITASKRLAVVTYGAGMVDLRRDSGRRAEVTHHFLGGGVERSSAEVAGERLRFAVKDGEERAVEWVEVSFLDI